MKFSGHVGACCLLIAIFAYEIQSASVDKDITLTRKEKETLDIFKERVAPILKKDYQKSDIYLIRWLRARHFDVRQAEELLQQVSLLSNELQTHVQKNPRGMTDRLWDYLRACSAYLPIDIQWRREHKMDSIHDEDWSDFEKEYPYFLEGYDDEGKPILDANFDEWDLRKGCLSGQRDRIMRWMAGAWDKANVRIRELQAQGKNVTQFDFIINMNNFNLIQHACIQCLPIYITFVANYESHFPGSADKIMLINTPQIFEIVLRLIRPIMSAQTREALKVYGNNKAEWDPILFSDIKRDQLPKTYGGTRANNF